MKKRVAVFGIATVLSIMGLAGMPLYIMAVIFLDWRSYLVFPPLSGLMALWLIYFSGDGGKTLDEFIGEKVKGRRKKIFLLFLFKKLKPMALLFSALFIGPAFTPIITELCILNIKKAYLTAIILNIFATAVWIWVYLGGKFIIEKYWELIKLSLGA